MKIIICGSRTITDYELVLDAIRVSNTWKKVTEVVSGGAKGVDSLGERWAIENGIPYKRFPALWNKLDVPGAVIDVHPNPLKDGYYNAKAGLHRNIEMGNYADACLAIINNKNDYNIQYLINYLKKIKKPYYIYKSYV